MTRITALVPLLLFTAAACAGVEAPGDDRVDDNVGIDSNALAAGTVSVSAAGVSVTPITPQLCVAPTTEDQIDERRSLVVTDQAILQDRFELDRVMEQIITTAGADHLTKETLFAQWFNFFSVDPNAGSDDESRLPHCNHNDQTVNGFDIQCPRSEEFFGDVANTPFAPEAAETYIPIALFNRVDAAPEDGANCGEFRIVYGKQGGPGRVLLIFEAVLPNPKPECGVEACRGVARHWANLSNIDDVTERAKQLEKFYFNGMKRDGMKFAPVVHADHYGPKGGQIRVNLFRSFADGWQLRDFQTDISDALSLIIKPASVKGNPHGPLFNSGSGEPLSGDFQDHFLTQLASLAADDLNGISMSTPLEFNAGQSNEQGPENDYATQLNQDPDYRDEIDFMLQDAGINLTAVEVARRATAMSCAGCHQLSNGDDLGDGLQWPTKSTAFVHTEENVLETGPDGARHKISEALTDLFLPARKTVLVDFINDTRCQKLVCDPVAITPSLISAKADNSLQGVKNTIGGTFVH